MTRRETPPFRADHVGQPAAPQASCSRPAPPAPPARSPRTSCGPSRMTAIATSSVCRRRSACSRRPTASSAVRPGTWTSSTGSAASADRRTDHRSTSATSRATSTSRRRRCWSTSRSRLPRTIFADAFTFLAARWRTGTPKLTIPSPSMVHYRGGRAAIDPAVYPDVGAFWADLSAAYAAEVRGARRLGCTYLQLDDTSLAYLNDPRAAGGARRPRRRRRAPARALHHPDQRCPGRPARRPRRDDAHVPGQLPLLLGRRGRLRLRRRSAVLPRSMSTASSWSTTTRAPEGSSRCVSSRRARSSCSVSSPPSAAQLECKDDLKRRIDEAASFVPLTNSACRRSAASRPQWRATC